MPSLVSGRLDFIDSDQDLGSLRLFVIRSIVIPWVMYFEGVNVFFYVKLISPKNTYPWYYNRT